MQTLRTTYLALQYRKTQCVAMAYAMRCNGLCNALTLLTHRIVFVYAPHCVFYFSMRYGQDDICGSQLITHNS